MGAVSWNSHVGGQLVVCVLGKTTAECAQHGQVHMRTPPWHAAVQVSTLP